MKTASAICLDIDVSLSWGGFQRESEGDVLCMCHLFSFCDVAVHSTNSSVRSVSHWFNWRPGAGEPVEKPVGEQEGLPIKREKVGGRCQLACA